MSFTSDPCPHSQGPGTSLTSPTSVPRPSSHFSLPGIGLFNKYTKLNPFNFLVAVYLLRRTWALTRILCVPPALLTDELLRHMAWVTA